MLAINSDPLLKFSIFPDSENLYLKHLHEIVISFIFYNLLASYVAPKLNSLIFKRSYNDIKNKKSKIDFDIHTVSMFQAFISLYILYPTLFLPVNLDITSYHDDLSSMVAALSIGYFLWDLSICIKHFSLYGIEFTAHALASLYIMFVTLKPLCQHWIGKFLLFEASTPFVNINWYIIQLNGSNKNKVPMLINVINGLCLMAVFFLVRLCWGCIANVLFFKQIWEARSEIPTIRSLILVGLNITLFALNFIWFSKMIKIAKKLAGKSSVKKA
ncbi:hypothetical protein KAFR_0A03270 [Kazachstania africana CBS 2517]|uniref:TLC domain-containing protein n=1 Tax=Kazachstania africana (strain ATCC 22294 / BCRC 22015 / CBS 2517 / CECT 1963 / NBRC 1671 / NRRL Y-8276) TaxID=1071382 RepID=H2AN12_KAZAF|nr:hypothetical protein KAFR_0A03270 [Kazachstania africana CBS 2517]CCF55762.1 hypothetical protein KAFR_0A03270 [Kazachstania africana CBS 2517]